MIHRKPFVWFLLAILLTIVPMAAFAQLLTVVAPNGGEHWAVGSTQRITWGAHNFTGPVAIMLNRHFPGDSGWVTIGTATIPSDGMNWVVTGPVGETNRIKVVYTGLPTIAIGDISDHNFTITEATPAPLLTVVAPNGGEHWAVGSTQRIRWAAHNFTGPVAIMLNRHFPGDSGWVTIGTATIPSDGMNWVVTGPVGETNRIKVVYTGLPAIAIGDVSDHNFSITLRHDGGGGAPGAISLDAARAALPNNGMLIAPNPFNPTTTISYRLPEDGWVKVTVFDVVGREVAQLASGTQASGIHTVAFDGVKMPSGLYIVAVKTAKATMMKKMFLLK